jgi:DNA ligase 1
VALTRTLYKLNNFNDVSWWRITCILSTDLTSYLLTTEWGHRLPIAVSGNTKTDSFSSFEKAEKEFYSCIREQINRKGYTEEIPSFMPSLPMRCQEYRQNPNFQAYALQPKLDGIRCIVSAEEILSRTNMRLNSVPHIELYAQHLPPGIKLDGELYIPNTPMNVIEGYVMRQVPDLKVCHTIEFHVFDIIDTEAPFSERIHALVDVVDRLEEKYVNWRTSPKSPYINHPYFSKNFPIKIVETVLHDTPTEEETIQDYFQECIKVGYEGCIVRDSYGPYEPNKRSKHILKLKEFFDNEFEIIDVVAGKNGHGIFVCQTKGREEFRCSFKGSAAIRKQQLKDRGFYIGKWLRVEHEGLFDTGKPRCPIGIHWYAKEDHD